MIIYRRILDQSQHGDCGRCCPYFVQSVESMGVRWQLSYFQKVRNRRDESIHSLESGRAVQLYMNLLDCCLEEFHSPCLPQIKGIKDWTENHLHMRRIRFKSSHNGTSSFGQTESSSIFKSFTVASVDIVINGFGAFSKLAKINLISRMLSDICGTV